MYNQNYNQLIDSWNKTLAVVAKLSEVPVALVMKVEQGTISVFSKNESNDNPYHLGDSEYLNGSGLYCEQVIKSQQQLNIPNALADVKWQNNPDLKLNMVAYLGLPIIDGEGNPFGTVCILDNKAHIFSKTTIELLETIKQSFEVQLQQLHQQHIEYEKQQLEELAMLIRGVSHEINTPLGVGITTTSIIESSIENIQQKLSTKSLNQKTLTNGLNTMLESVNLLTNSLKNAAKHVRTLQDLLVSDKAVTGQLVNLSSLVKNIIEKNTMKLNNHKVEYCIEQNVNLDTQAFLIPNLFQQVLLILCKNSLEHGLLGLENPAIHITFKNFTNVIKLDYQDNGKGIDKTEHNKIFAPFYTTNRAIGCSGVGLSIVKRIITQQLHGEIIVVESSSGAHFVISLPKTADSVINY